MLKFYWNGIKADTTSKLWRVFYSDSPLSRHPHETLTIYARDYTQCPKAIRDAFTVENESDIMTDYFETDMIRVLPGHPLYAQVKAAHEAANAHNRVAVERRCSKLGLAPSW